MRLLGQLLREAARGTVELLLSRAALKREMRAEQTVITTRQNNPLKFSPTAEVALQYLLSARGQISKRGELSAMLPGSRKAQLWQQFQTLYAQLSQEASDDFHGLFGDDFVAAYQGCIEQLQSQA